MNGNVVAYHSRAFATPSACRLLPARSDDAGANAAGGPDWIHEAKHDGYRLLARKDAGRVTLWRRYGADFTDKLPRSVEAVRSLPVEDALLDGEAVAMAIAISRR
jgi:ATP-dependent DNA ligase